MRLGLLTTALLGVALACAAASSLMGEACGRLAPAASPAVHAVSGGAAPAVSAASASAPSDSVSRVFEDVLGHRVAWSCAPRRIVSLSPNITEILFALGCDSCIVGVTRFCDFPPAAETLPEVGGIVDPSLEAVFALRPDLVLATRGNPLEFMEALSRLGVPLYALETRGTLDRILEMIGEVAAITGREREGAKLLAGLRERRARVVSRTGRLDPSARPRVYYGELEGPLWTAGPGSSIHNLIEDAGGENVAAGAPSAWCALSLEAVIAGDPQVYLGAVPETGAAAEARIREFLRRDPAWSATSLGRDPRILLIDEDRLMRPGPRLFDVLEELSRFLHPEAWD